MMRRFDVVTLFVVLALACVLVMVACMKVSRPRHDPWQPEELSGLSPPFPSPTNGIRKVSVNTDDALVFGVGGACIYCTLARRLGWWPW